jgi:hypothetical protein
MIDNINLETLLDDYYKFLRDENKIIKSIHTGTEWSVITTPYVGLFNDAIEIYIKQSKNIIHLSDDGITFANLELLGFHVSRSDKRKKMVEKILHTYGVEITKDYEIFVETNLHNLVQKKFSFISAISEINNLYVLTKDNVHSVFVEDVKSYLDKHDIIYTPSFIIKGKTGLEFTFDFQIARKDKEVVIKSFGDLNNMNISTFLFSLSDIKPVRMQETKKDILGIAYIDDTKKTPSPKYISALKSKGTLPVLWSERDTNSIELLIA